MLDAEAIGLQPAAADAGGPQLEEGETVLHKFERLQLVIGAAADQGEGTLFITEGRIVWLSPAGAGYSCDFPTVAMHAVVADEESAGRPCLYLQLDSGEEEEGGSGGMMMGLGGAAAAASGSDDGADEEGGEEEEEEEDAEDELSPELRLVPADAAQLDALFQAFCEGAERNPDYSEGSEDEEGGGGFFYDEDAALAGAAAAALGVGDVEELVGADPGRFEDADEEEEEDDEEDPASGNGGTARQPNGGC